MRQIAKDKGEKISEYGVENLETGEVKTFETEEEFFAHFRFFHLSRQKCVKMEKKLN